MSPDNRPLTPPIGVETTRLPSIHSTPQSQGSGSHYSYRSQHVQDDYKSYLADDIKHLYTLQTFDDFSRDILDFDSLDWIAKNESQISRIVDAKDFQDKVSHYCQPVSRESDRYQPFVELANYVTGKLGQHAQVSFTFCRNDPTIVKGSDGQRKPDVVGVRWKSLEQLPERSSPDNLKKDGPGQEVAFWWTELVSFWEFKLVHKDLSKPVAEDISTRNRSSTVTPATLKLPAGGPSAEFKIRKPRLQRSPTRSHTMSTRKVSASVGTSHTVSTAVSGSGPSSTPAGFRNISASSVSVSGPRLPSTSTSGSKRASNATHSDTSHKSKRMKGDDDAMLQCASYALEMLSHGGLRSHVIAALVTDDTVQLLYYDRSIIIMSPPLNFLEDSFRFLAMLKAISNLSLKQWGYVEKLKPTPLLDNPRKSKDIFSGLELSLEDGTRLKLGETVFHQHGLIGRGTCVIRATCVENRDGADAKVWNGPLIVKLSWPAKSRTPEHVILEQAYKAANHDEHRWVLKHLPKMLHTEDVNTNLLSQALIDRMGDEYEERVLRIMVQEALYPVTEQITTPTLALSFREIFNCYRWLYKYPKILHRDISLYNLMLRKEADKVYGVLNDFDLAVRTDAKSPSSKQRTGTRPFMAIDLLQRDASIHMYRHDLESMFYVLVWITSRFHNGEEIADPPLQGWADHGDTTLVEKKTTFIMSEPPIPTMHFEVLGRWVVSMREMIHDGFEARTRYRSQLRYAKAVPPPHFDDETLGSLVTFDKFQAILDVKLL